MKVLWLPLLCGYCHAWKHVTEAALRSALADNDHTLVTFIHPSLKTCEDLEPEWKSIQSSEKSPNIVSFDCKENPKICQELKILSYPSVRLYHRDNRIDRYRGPRKASSIISFLRRALRPTLQEVNDKTLTSFQTVDDVVFVGQIDPSDESLNARYKVLANQYRDRYSFGIARSRKGQSIVQCFNNIDDEQYVADELGLVEGLENFVKKCSAPLIPELTRTNEAEYAQSGKSIMHFFVTTEKEKEKFREEARPLAKKYKEFLHFAMTDLNEYPEMLGIVGLKPGAKTGLALQNPNTGEMFPYTGKKKITPEVVDKFLNDIIDGKIPPKGGRSQGYGHTEL